MMPFFIVFGIGLLIYIIMFIIMRWTRPAGAKELTDHMELEECYVFQIASAVGCLAITALGLLFARRWRWVMELIYPVVLIFEVLLIFTYNFEKLTRSKPLAPTKLAW